MGISHDVEVYNISLCKTKIFLCIIDRIFGMIIGSWICKSVQRLDFLLRNNSSWKEDSNHFGDFMLTIDALKDGFLLIMFHIDKSQ